MKGAEFSSIMFIISEFNAALLFVKLRAIPTQRAEKGEQAHLRSPNAVNFGGRDNKSFEVAASVKNNCVCKRALRKIYTRKRVFERESEIL